MNDAQRTASLLSIIVTLLMPVVLIVNCLYVFMTPAFVRFEYSQPSFPPAERFTSEAREYNSVKTVEYEWGRISLQDLQNLGVYNDREIKHLVDVQNVARGALIFHAISLILILVALVLLARSTATRPWAARALMQGGILTFVVMAAIGIFSLVAFDQFFVAFHHIFFEGNSWLFEHTDSLIQLYPEPFWETASYGIALFVIASALIVSAAGWIWQRSMSRRLAPAPAA